MKPVLTLILCTLLYPISTSAQKAKSEFALLLYSNEIALDIRPIKIDNHFLNGFQFKYGLNNNYMIRLTSQFSDKIEENNFSLQRNKRFDNSLGVEKVYSKGKLRPFAFADIFYRYLNTNIKGNNYWGSRIPLIPENSSALINSEYSEHFLGTTFGFGLKYFPVNHVFITAEAAFTFSRNIYDGNLTPQYQFNLNPVRVLTLGVNF